MRLGVVGFSEGNGHPYSWSALINGYRPESLGAVPFAAIREYLPTSGPIGDSMGAAVTHIWSPDLSWSRQVAQFANIEHVASSLHELVESVDAIIHARDDFENHHSFLRFYSKFRKPVFMDKPLATTRATLDQILQMDPELGWIFSCSALAYDPVFEKIAKEKEPVLRVRSFSPKNWSKYSIHLVEPVLNVLGFPSGRKETTRQREGLSVGLKVAWDGGQQADFFTSGVDGGGFVYYFDDTKVVIESPVSAFSGALDAFVRFAKGESSEGRVEQLEAIVEMIELGGEE